MVPRTRVTLLNLYEIHSVLINSLKEFTLIDLIIKLYSGRCLEYHNLLNSYCYDIMMCKHDVRSVDSTLWIVLKLEACLQ